MPLASCPSALPTTPDNCPCTTNYLPGWHDGQYHDIPKEPLFAFGYGLSYTQYRYGKPSLETTNGKVFACSHHIKNTGQRDGAEIVQLYAHRPSAGRMTPVKELIDFARVPLKAQEAKEVSFSIHTEPLKTVRTDGSRVLETGEYTLMVGSSSRDEDLQKVGFTL